MFYYTLAGFIREPLPAGEGQGWGIWRNHVTAKVRDKPSAVRRTPFIWQCGASASYL